LPESKGKKHVVGEIEDLWVSNREDHTQIQLTNNHSLLLEIRKPAKNPKTTEKKSKLLPDTKNSNASPQHENLRILAASHQELKRHFTFKTCRATF
jgi:hypothetical protein